MQSKIKLFTLLFISGALFFIGCQSEVANQETAQAGIGEVLATLAKQTVNPPMNNLDIQYNHFEVSASEAKTLELENGTTIEIPANAFVDAEGNPVTTPVDIQYREFHNAADILVSGIPMEVLGDKGQKSRMQTAGMFQMSATAAGEEVFIAEGKELAVNMASHVDGEYDFWYFDEEKGNWDGLGAVNPQPNPKIAEMKIAMERYGVGGEKLKEGKSYARKPIAPVKFSKSKPALNFDVNYDQFPELKQMQGIVWQFSGSDDKLAPQNNRWIFKEDWEHVTLEASEIPNQYKMVLSNEGQTFIMPVVPSRKGKDFKKAVAEYNAQMNDYKEAIANKSDLKEMYKKQAEFVRSFNVNRFGIYNHDILMKDNGNIRVLADFDFGPIKSNMKKMIPVYMVTGEGRSVVAFPYENWDLFVFDPEIANCLVAVLPGNKVATFSAAEFMQQKDKLKAANDNEYVFKMKILDTQINSVQELQGVLNSIS